uniref:Uncharacterized protein n=1 Tax=Castor canadensis TaxID=51338 RepID=A0A8C0W4L7_CASCN
MSQKSMEAESSASSSPRLLDGEEPEPLSSGSGYLPFFRTSGRLLVEEELTLQPEVGKDQETPWSVREEQFPEDSVALRGFFPYYRSQEENLPGLALPSWWRQGSQDPHPGREAHESFFCGMTVRDRCPVASAGAELFSKASYSPACSPRPLVPARLSWDSSLDVLFFRSHTLCTSEFVPYYRSPEEGLRTSPGPPTSVSGSQGKLAWPGAATW